MIYQDIFPDVHIEVKKANSNTEGDDLFVRYCLDSARKDMKNSNFL